MAVYRNKASEVDTRAQFYQDVVNGLNAEPKYLLAKYFYDYTGDRLFQQIMQCPEYYLTRSEMEIFSEQTAVLADVLTDGLAYFDVLELGAGDAAKSKHLLAYLRAANFNFSYYPIDISTNIINHLAVNLPKQVPGINIYGLNGEYLEMIKRANRQSSYPKVLLFLGSSIGNLTKQEALTFLLELSSNLAPGDRLLLGFDLKKDPAQILAAYNDKTGYTRAFNLNLLKRINRELNADFNVNNFSHYPVYDPASGACKSYLISLKEQLVTINDTTQVQFGRHEPIYMELSQKYSLNEINDLATIAGFKAIEHFSDSRGWFVDVVWQKQ